MPSTLLIVPTQVGKRFPLTIFLDALKLTMFVPDRRNGPFMTTRMCGPRLVCLSCFRFESYTNCLVVRQVMHVVRSEVMKTCFDSCESCDTSNHLPINGEMSLDNLLTHSTGEGRRSSASYFVAI